MANPTFVVIVGPTVTDTFGGKYKASVTKTVKASLEKAINASSKLEVRAAKDKNERGLGVQYKVSVTKTDKGVDVAIEVLLYNVQGGQQKLVPIRTRPASASKEGVAPGRMDEA